MNEVSLTKAAQLLGLSVDQVKLLQKQGLLNSTRNIEGEPYFLATSIARLQSHRHPTLEEEAMEVGFGIQREMSHSITSVRKVILFAGGMVGSYCALVVVLVCLFIALPVKTADWLGFTKANTTIALENSLQGNKVIAADNGVVSEKKSQELPPTTFQNLIQPAGKAALYLVRSLSPRSYATISKVTILDPNDILRLDANGTIIPARPISIPETSLFRVDSDELIANLNSEYLQGRHPGTNPGDIAIVGESGTTTTGGTTSPVVSANTAAQNNTSSPSALSPAAGTNTTDILGPVSSLTGLLVGDVTGTPESTTVAKINGSTLGITTPTAGNLLLGNGTSWITQALSGDATITSGGVLSLKNTGTAGSHGSSSNIPVFVTDAQGRISSVTDTAISSLTVSHFASPNISQWTNNSGYITISSTDTLTNKTIDAGSNSISGLTNSNLSGAAGITNANLANSSIAISGNSGSGSVSLGGGLTFTGTGITNIVASGSTMTVTSTEADTLASVTGRGATTATALTLSSLSNAITAGTLTASGGTINAITIGATTPSTGAFTTLSSTGTTNIGQGTGAVTLNSSGALNLTNASASTWTLANVANSLNFDANTLSLDALNNRVGIGTATPGFGLSVVGNTAAGNVAAISNLNTTSSASNSILRMNMGTASGTNLSRFLQFYAGSTSDSDGTGVGNIRVNGAGVAFATGNADLAEWTDVSESVVAGDIIASLSTGNKKAVAGNLVLGVVSDTAAVIGNETGDLTGKAIIGMLGRVNTKVSTENGDIAIGDPIAASSVAGVGMKQTKAGPTIGKALVAYASPGVSRIAIQVVPGWFDPDPLLDPSSFTISGADILDQNSDVVTRVGGFQDIFVGDISIADELTLATGDINLTATSGSLALSGLSASSLSTGANSLTVTSSNFNTTATGINSTAIGQTTAATGKFTTITSTGGTDLANAGASNVTIATTGTGNVTIGNSSGTFALASNGGLNLTTGGALTGVASIDTIGTSATGLTFAGAGTVSSTTTNGITLDSGTTGAVNVGNGANAKTITIGNTTAGTGININAGTGNVNFTVGNTGSSGKVQIGNSATTTPDLLVLDNGTADPTGTNGAMYYNTATNKFRCFQNSAWANCITTTSNIQHAVLNDTDEALTNVTAAQVTLGTVSVTPSTTTGDIFVMGFAEVRSSNGTDQAFNLVIETTSNCTGTTVGTASNTYTITSAGSTTNHFGNIRISGIAVDAGTLAHPYSLCASTATGDTDVLNWGIDASVIDTGADVSEIYSSNDASIEAGDVVSVDPNLKTGIKKSQTAYDQTVLGIISTNPGLVIGGVSKEGVNAKPLALSGRVPVKVSTENGSIKPGDSLTTSSIPGVAMKATHAGPVIGMALSEFSEKNIGIVLVFIKNSSNLNSIEITQVQDEALVSKKVTEAITHALKNVVDFFGNVIFHADVAFLGRPTFNKDTAGHAVVKARSNEVRIDFEKKYAQNPIVTASLNLSEDIPSDEIPSYAVYDVSAEGFTIKLAKPVQDDLPFSWIALSNTASD